MCSETGCLRTIIHNNKFINKSSLSSKHLLQAVIPAYCLSDIKQGYLGLALIFPLDTSQQSFPVDDADLQPIYVCCYIHRGLLGAFFVNYLPGQLSGLKYRKETAATGGNLK